MKSAFILFMLVVVTLNLFAQKESFDVASYTPVKGWKKELTDKSVSFSKTVEAKGTFCIISIYQSTNGDADSKINFDNSWKKIVQEPLGASNAAMEAVSTQNGWELQTGSAQFNKGGLAGIAMLITATSNDKMVNLLVLFNSEIYMTQLNDFIASVKLKKVPQSNNKSKTTSTSLSNNNTAIVGIWASNLLETSGYANGYAQYSGGYFRKEYTFKSDGTYTHFIKTWSVYSKPIRYVYETGTWSANENTLTISPASGKAQEWSKSANNRTNEWGSLLKSQNAKLEKVAYSFEIKYYPGSQSTSLLLNSGKTTERDGTQTNDSFNYNLRDKSIIDFPPGFKIKTSN